MMMKVPPSASERRQSRARYAVAISSAPKAMMAIAIAVFATIAPASATWKPDYTSQPFEVQFWYRNAELTKEAQQRFPFKKCCDHADVFRTKFRVDNTSGADEWDYLVDGAWKRIPPDIVHVGEHAPDGQPTLFIYDGKETCFFPGDSGI